MTVALQSRGSYIVICNSVRCWQLKSKSAADATIGKADLSEFVFSLRASGWTTCCLERFTRIASGEYNLSS